MTSIDRTAYPRFKRMITTRELADSFTPSSEEIEWARDMTLSDPHLLALAVWLKSYRRAASRKAWNTWPAASTASWLCWASYPRRS